MAHSRDCRFSPMFPHCNCGEEDRAERLETLEEKVRDLEAELERLKTCDTCANPATRHVCTHHCYRE